MHRPTINLQFKSIGKSEVLMLCYARNLQIIDCSHIVIEKKELKPFTSNPRIKGISQQNKKQ